MADARIIGYEAGVVNGRVRPGDVVAVIGTGPIGSPAISGARLFSASRWDLSLAGMGRSPQPQCCELIKDWVNGRHHLDTGPHRGDQSHEAKRP